MSKIFISYRRDDARGYAHAIHSQLRRYFNADQLFIDVDTILPGQDFVEILENAVSSCNVFIAVIGSDWLNISNEDGQRRLDDPSDFVRIEIESALKQGTDIIPVLLHGAEMPSSDELPETIKQLTNFQAISTGENFEADVNRVRLAIDHVFGEPSVEKPKLPDKKPRNWGRIGKFSFAILAAAVAIIYVLTYLSKISLPILDFIPTRQPNATAVSNTPEPVIQGENLVFCEESTICIEHTDGSTQTIDIGPDYRGNYDIELTWSPNGEQIVFSGCHQDDMGELNLCNWNLYFTDRQGNVSPFIVNSDNFILSPTWSPNGEWIAYSSDGGLKISRIDLSETRTFLSGPSQLADFIAWSPDSQRLAFLSSNEDQIPDSFWVINVDGSGLEMIYKPEDAKPLYDRSVAWSPDGKSVATLTNEGVFLVGADCNSLPSGCDENSRTKLDSFPTRWLPTYYPQWAGEEIVVEGENLDYCGASEGHNICIYHTDGTTSVIDIGSDYRIDHYGPELTWSPDGEQIVFAACHVDDLVDGFYCEPDLYITDRQGNLTKFIRDPGITMFLPTWSPDGEWIAYHGNGDLIISRTDRSETRTLVATPFRVPRFIAWSPNSQRLVFTITDENNVAESVWVINVNGGGKEMIFKPDDQMSENRSVAWSPDGKFVVAVTKKGTSYLIDADCNDKLSGCDDSSRTELDKFPTSWLPTFYPQWAEKVDY